ncbi:hypothetical protein EVAR_72453_1 [Eumeta japonica]|uniref:Uncharacterized protein n=1 Tax=Eumeta variegata TaxID=151549 RepID=A0A4C1T354_EUMVA|nr:hypothetical protein EVAR_72453_1 [Eumeta japonica]
MSCNSLTFCYRNIEAWESLGLVKAYRIFRGEGLWLCYRIALRALPRVIISVPWGAVAYQQTVFEIPGLSHDAHLLASSRLFGMPGLWKERALARSS